MIDICKIQVLEKVKELTKEREHRTENEKDMTSYGCRERLIDFFANDDEFKEIDFKFSIVRSSDFERGKFEVVVYGKNRSFTIGIWDDYEEKMHFLEPIERSHNRISAI